MQPKGNVFDLIMNYYSLCKLLRFGLAKRIKMEKKAN